MGKKIFCYWKMGGFEEQYQKLDMCRGLKNRTAELIKEGE